METETESMTFYTDGSYIGDGTRGSNFVQIQQWLGKRPGDYRLDPYYLRHSMGNKPYFWDAIKKKWKMVKLGDKFYFDNDGIPVKESVDGK